MRTPSLALLTLPLAATILPAQDSTATRPERIADSSITVPAGARVFTEVQRQVRMRFAKTGDTVYLVASVPVVVGSQAAIPAGTFVMAVFDTIKRRGARHSRYEVALRVTRLVFPNGRVIAASVPARGEANGASGLRQESRFLHRATVVMDVGLPVELELRGSLHLDPRVVLSATEQGGGSARGVRTAALLRTHLCYRPGIPGTPDVTIPGSPGTPPTIDSPGTPATPATVIPGTPDIPARWYPCH
jgi:hypothetical protein